MSEKMFRTSVVIPVYNEEANLAALMARLAPVLKALPGPGEAIFVNDGSTDGSARVLEEIRKQYDGLVRVVWLARNFGQHAAVLAGLEQAGGDLVVTMDADMQNPPEEIAKIAARFAEGFDYIGTIRQNRQDTLFRKTASKLMNRFVRHITGIRLQDFGCMLRGYSQQVVRAVLKNMTYRTFIPALGYLVSSRPTEITVAHEARMAGKSNYSLFKLFQLQLDLIICFSLWPISMLFVCGLVISLLGVALGVFILAMRLWMGVHWAAEGIFTLFAISFLFTGFQFLCLGFIGEYIGRIYHRVVAKPLYVVRDTPE